MGDNGIGMDAASQLAKALTDQALRELAGEQSYERGLEYAYPGTVFDIKVTGNCLSGCVLGNSIYSVTIRCKKGNRLAWKCTCPVGEEGDFCKHAVALALVWKKGRKTGAKPKVSSGPAQEATTIKQFIESQDRETLVRIVKERAAEDPELRQKFRLAVAQQRTGGPDIEAYREEIRDATTTGGFVEYREMPSYVGELERAADSIEKMIGGNHPGAAIELAEFMLKRLERTIEQVDDSDGDVGDVMNRLQEIHHRACVKARPEPVALARGLFEWEMTSEWEVFIGAAGTYARVLGQKGLAEYRRLAEAEWRKVPVLKPGVREDVRERYGRRFKITEMMRGLARATGGLDAEIAVMSRDLSTAYQYLQIAEKLRQARRFSDAKDWAKRGMDAFGEKADGRLAVFLANEYHRCGDHAEAMKLAWQQFEEFPHFAAYKSLKDHAVRADEWPAWRERAIALIRSEKEAGRARKFGAPPMDAATLVQIFLWENNPTMALREAEAGGCPGFLWREIARALEQTDPERAVTIYKEQLPGVLAKVMDADYRPVIKLVKRVLAILKRLGRSGEFPEYVLSLRERYKAKRNFMKLLADQGWSKPFHRPEMASQQRMVTHFIKLAVRKTVK